MLPQKYIIAVLGDAYEGKTTTINKTFNKLAGSKIISGVTSVWGPLRAYRIFKPGRPNMLHLCKFGKVSADGVSGDCMRL